MLPAKNFQEKKNTFRNDASERSTSGVNNKIKPTPDAVSQNSSFIPMGVFSNQELFEVDAMTNPRKKRKKYMINQTEWRAPYDEEVPWLIKDNVRKYKSAIQRLHYEIEEFVAYLCPTDIERMWRVFAIRRIEECIKSSYPDAEIMVFGSFNTGLYLPTSDLDIVCFIRENSQDILKQIAQLLYYHRISEERPITLTKAVVPIIKFRECHTKFNVDISFNQSSGYTSSRAMKSYLDQWPSLGNMVIIVKWFLKHHGLDDPSNGGMGGFTVFCMMLSFFQTHPLIRSGILIPDNENLGVLLIEFFELYGLKFNFFKVAIRVNDGGEYVLKDKESWTTKIPRTNICIQDPSDSDNDIARSTRNTEIIFSHFEKAFQRLVVRVGSLERKYRIQDNEMDSKINEESILSSILFMPRKIIELRRELHRLYAENQEFADEYGSTKIIPPRFSYILYNFHYQIEYADRLRIEKASKLSNKNGTYKIKPIKTRKEYLDMASKCKDEVDTYREFPCERSNFLPATYGDSYKKIFYSEVEHEHNIKIKNRNKNRFFVAESSKGESSSSRYKRRFEESRYERHKFDEIVYYEHDSEEYEDDYVIQPTPKRRKGNRNKNKNKKYIS
ncbi:hypothetical protein RhiirA5_352341 [Rhizophagus irregularis]|uniref:polynucleotide adenylyltransferase n=3 Tax=Rhizophagus irregularis TaxID=588596 RepID=A0A2I1DW53_9GLOM|nr:hypothetical protein RhiirA5_352341 [Rhizophagus irregularis]GBC42803.1 non-canonical poly(A) RNA polymerase PAPD7 isoform X1 [Rhizophagus irregularis DAOM 181602=DAOM 197198]PKC74938.1 hypothetical protein RhiirA1_408422 [Rhizophagus irregularis]PKY14100.1 hypothetical protein RhiirB3_399843 [Rhizophagus irregularis]UZO16736.1 hypothetical protein OCT59_008116 [Rhizophagus irregularis]